MFLYKIIKYPILCSFIAVISVIFVLIFSIHPAEAQLQYTPEVGIPGEFEETMDVPGDTSAIGNYIKAIYSYSIGIVGILAAVVLMIGGVTWLTAGGNANKVESAKQWIGGALTGMVLALSSYMILLQINPELVNFHVREIHKTAQSDLELFRASDPSCSWVISSTCNEHLGEYEAEDPARCGTKIEENLQTCCCDGTGESECIQDGSGCSIHSVDPEGMQCSNCCSGEYHAHTGMLHVCGEEPEEGEEIGGEDEEVTGCCLYQYVQETDRYYSCSEDITEGDCHDQSGSVQFQENGSCVDESWWLQQSYYSCE